MVSRTCCIDRQAAVGVAPLPHYGCDLMHYLSHMTPMYIKVVETRTISSYVYIVVPLEVKFTLKTYFSRISDR